MIARRRFLKVAGATTAAAIAHALLPLGARAVTRLRCNDCRAEDWHVDDMWGHVPRYAQAIPHAGVSYAPVTWEHWEPIDHILMI